MADRLALLVDNEVGVLAKVAGLLAGKGCNIEFIASERGPANPSLMKLTVEVSGGEAQMPHLCALLEKMLPIHSVERILEA